MMFVCTWVDFVLLLVVSLKKTILKLLEEKFSYAKIADIIVFLLL